MANRGKMRQIEDVIRSKIVVEIGVFYYRCPCVTLGDLECIGVLISNLIFNRPFTALRICLINRI